MRLYVKSLIDNNYQPLEYLEGDGACYFKTGYTFSQPNIRVLCKYRKSTSTAKCAYGAAENTDPRMWHGTLYADDAYLGDGNAYPNIPGAGELDVDYVVDFTFQNDIATWIINGQECVYNGNNGWTGCDKEDYLFAINRNNAPVYVMTGRIYYHKMWDNGVLVRNYIPVRRKSDNALGMYDLVTKTFFDKKGAGTFTAGPAITLHKNYFLTKKANPSKLPDGYKRLADIINDGSANYILTGVIPTENTGIRAVYEYHDVDGSTPACITGTYISSGKGTLFVSSVSGLISTATKALVSQRGKTLNSTDNIAANIEYTAEVNWLNSGLERLNDSSTTVGTDAANPTGLRIFSRFNSGNNTWAYGKAKIKSFQVSEGTKIIRDYIPAQRLSDGAVGMYERIDGRFYANNGSGTFTSSTPLEVAGYEQLDYIESDGNQSIELDYQGYSKINLVAQGTKVADKSQVVIGPSAVAASWFGTPSTGGKWGLSNSAGYFSNVSYLDKITADLIFDSNGASFTLNGSTYTLAGTFTTTRKYKIFTTNPTGTGIVYSANVKIFSCQIYDLNDVLQLDLIPVRRISDGELGLYDKVNSVFYANEGTGTFKAGERLANYQPVEYITSSNDAYIDLGMIGNQNTSVEITGKAAAAMTACRLFGSRTSSGSNALVISSSNTTNIYFNFGTQSAGPTNNITQLHTYALISGSYYIDGNKIGTMNSTAFTTPTNLLLFNAISEGEPGSGRVWTIYKAKVWQDGIQVRNLIPVKKVSTDEYGMFDTINQVFYGNVSAAANSTFIGGSAVTLSKHIMASVGKKGKFKKDIETITSVYSSTNSQFAYLDSGWGVSTANLAHDIDIKTTIAIPGGSAGLRTIILGNYHGLLNTTFSIETTALKKIRLYIDNATIEWINANTLPVDTPIEIHYTYNATTYQHTCSIRTTDGSIDETMTPATLQMAADDTYNCMIGRDYRTPATAFGALTIYKMEITNGDFHVNYIPMQVNDIVSLYDTVSNTLLENKGNVPFIPGKRITEVEYLQSGGIECIDTGYKAHGLTGIKMCTKVLTSGTTYILTTADGSATGDCRYIVAQQQSGNFLFYEPGIVAGVTGRVITNVAGNDGEWHLIETKNTTSNSKIYIDNESKGTTGYVGDTWESGTNIQLFYYQSNSTSVIQMSMCQIREGDTLLRDFIPVKDEDGVGCMFDKVSHSLFRNTKGTNGFRYGPEITLVDKLVSTGTEYITAVSGSVDDTYGIKAVLSMNGTPDSYPISATTNSSNRILYYGPRNNSLMSWCYGWGSTSTGSTTPRYSFTNYPEGIDNYYTGYLNFLNDKCAAFEDETPTTLSSSTDTFTNTDINVFRSLFSSVIAGVKEVWISKGTDIIRDLVPAKDEYGSGYLFDKIRHVLHPNSGTGNFIIGKRINKIIGE